MRLEKKDGYSNKILDLSIYDSYYVINEKYIYVLKDNKEGIIDFNGNKVIEIKYDDICYEDNYFITLNNSKYGIIDSNLNEIKCQFDSIDHLEDNIFIVKIGNKRKLIEINNSVYFDMSFTYDYIDFYNKDILIVRKDNKTGIINDKGKIIISAIYDSIRVLDDNLFVCIKDGKSGIKNINNKQIIPFKYDSIHKYSNNFFTCRKNDKTEVINKYGDIIFKTKYLIISDFKNGYALITSDNKYGIIDMFGNVIIEPIYDGKMPIILKDRFIFINSDEIKIINKNKDEFNFELDGYIDKNYCVKKNNKYGVINISDGNLILNTIYDSICPVGKFNDIKFFIATLDNKYYLFDINGNLIGNKYFDNIRAIPFIENYFIVQKDDNKYIINEKGNLINFVYDNVSNIKNDLIDVELKNKHGVINVRGDKIIPLVYDRIIFEGNYIIVKENDIYKVFDKYGKLIINQLNEIPTIKNDYIFIEGSLYNLNDIIFEYKLLLYNNDDLIKEDVFDNNIERNKYYDNYSKELTKINKRIGKYRRKQNKLFKDNYIIK